MLHMTPAVQFVQRCADRQEAEAALRHFALVQVDSLGGRVLENFDHTPGAFGVQAFFSAEGVEPDATLPDGCRLVQVPARMLTCPVDSGPR